MHDDLADGRVPPVPPPPAAGKFVELTNVSSNSVELQGCAIVVNGGALGIEQITTSTVLAPNQIYVFAGSNPGFVPDASLITPALGQVSSSVALICDFGATSYAVDTASYDTGAGTFPPAGVSLMIPPGSGATANDNPGDWCASTSLYASDIDGGFEYLSKYDFGTPGQPNDACVLPGTVADCSMDPGQDLVWSYLVNPHSVGVKVIVNGFTSITGGANEPSHPLVTGNPIVAPTIGTSTDPSTWAITLNRLLPTDPWAGGATDADPLYAFGNAPSPGAYRLAFRVSADGGQTYTYCDGNALPFDLDDTGYVMSALPFLHFSEYLRDGTDRMLEIHNPTTGVSSMNSCAIKIYPDDDPTNPRSVALPNQILAAGDVHTVCITGISATYTGACDGFSTELTYDANDAIVLECSATVYDAIGQVGDATAWATDPGVLERDCVAGGDPEEADAFDVGRHWNDKGTDAGGLGVAPTCP